MKRVIGWFIFGGLFFVFLLLFPTETLAQNKMGINIGSKFDLFDQAASVVGSGGWVVVMACPGDGDALAEMIQSHPEINLIIRGHFPGQPLNRDWAFSWAATLGSLPTDNKIYFMPWNEPNQAGTDDWGEPSEVIAYINDVIEAFNQSGLRGKKVALLSTMLNHTWVGGAGDFDTYVGRLRSIDNNFFSQFDGIAMNLYDFGEEICGSPLCAPDPHFNPAKFADLLKIMGASGKPVFGVESGTAGQNFYWRTAPSSSSPLYRFVQAFASRGEKMFAIPAYDLAGERGHSWSLFEPADTVNLMKSLAQPTSPEKTSGFNQAAFETWRGTNASLCPESQYAWGVTEADCQECGGAGKIYRAPIGYLDQMNITAEKEIDPFQSKQLWFWAECYQPGSGWDVDCVEALNKMGFSSDNPLHYPLWLQEWRDYMVNTVLPRRTPYHLQKEVVEYAQEEGNFPVQGWVEFVTSGENNEGKRTKITNPRAWLFGAKFVGQLSYATDWVWRSFTGLYDQLKKPVLVRDGREPHFGEVAPNNGIVDFGALNGPPPGLFAGDMIKGSCVGKSPYLDCGAPSHCSKHCCKLREPITGICLQWRDGKDEKWAMRQINPDIPGHDMIETLNPGWEALANSWSNIANPINGFVPAIARKHDLEINMSDDCPDLFGSEEDLQAYSLAASRDLRPSLCSWRYAKTPFTYNYGPFVPGVVEEQMEAQACAAVINPEDLDASRKEKECYAHWPFVGGLQKVKEFIHQFTNTFRHYGLAEEGVGSIAEIKSQSLSQYLNEAGATFKVPPAVLAGVMNFEGFHPNGPHLFDYPEEWVIEDSQPGAKDRYCATSPAGAKGPMQFMPGQWNTYKNAAIEAGARPAGYKPEICNILDSLYAAAKKLRDDLDSYNDSCACASGVCAQAPAPTGVNWSKADVYHTSCHYYGNCGSNYCATVWLYYQNSGE